MAARQQASLPVSMLELAFQLVDPAITVVRHIEDGSAVEAGDIIATISGPSRGLADGRADGVELSRAPFRHRNGHRRVGTGCRADEGGDRLHPQDDTGSAGIGEVCGSCRRGHESSLALNDAVLIKDNHVAIAGGVAEAIRRARAGVGHLVKIEVEVDTLEQLREAMEVGVDAVLLDNMTPEQLRQAVAIVDRRAITEASGGVNLQQWLRSPPPASILSPLAGARTVRRLLDIGLDMQS